MHSTCSDTEACFIIGKNVDNSIAKKLLSISDFNSYKDFES